MSVVASCTVTAVINNHVYACGHTITSFGAVDMPMSRSRVITTLSSDMDSTKITTTGGVIGTFTDDRLTAIAGTLGTTPRMIPVELALDTPTAHRDFKFQLADNPKLTPLLVGFAAYNGLVSNNAYSEGTTLRLSGDIDIDGHSSVHLDNMFTPTDASVPDGTFVAVTVQTLFSRIFTNPYEIPKIDSIHLKLESMPDRLATAIDGAWADETEAETRTNDQRKSFAAAVSRRTRIAQRADHDSDGSRSRHHSANSGERCGRVKSHHAQRTCGSRLKSRRPGTTDSRAERRAPEQLSVRQLLKPTPTLLVEDKALPNAPLSELNIMQQQRGAMNATVLRESVAGEWAVPLNRVVSGAAFLTIHIR